LSEEALKSTYQVRLRLEEAGKRTQAIDRQDLEQMKSIGPRQDRRLDRWHRAKPI
jgi:hypothetical protein